MTRNKRAFRLAMLGVLCAGLLMMGIGAGVAFAEYSSFTYAGQRVPERAQLQSESFTAVVDPEADKIAIASYGAGLRQLAENARVEVSEELEPGTVQIDFQYRSVASKIRADWDRLPLGNTIRVHWYNTGSDMDLLLTYKDQILEDIRARQLGDYGAIQLIEAVITVNPADAGKIILD